MVSHLSPQISLEQQYTLRNDFHGHTHMAEAYESKHREAFKNVNKYYFQHKVKFILNGHPLFFVQPIVWKITKSVSLVALQYGHPAM